jgi:peptidoglycan/xylan/chitin deacetylase (PgdA/CDA1 family)
MYYLAENSLKKNFNSYIFGRNKCLSNNSMKKILFSVSASALLICCSEKSTQPEPASQKEEAKVETVKSKGPDTIASAATIIQRPQVPILCYHRIDDSRKPDDYNVTVAEFKEQMKALADSGYHTILPDQLYDYLTKGTALPSKPFMITFDDTRKEQFTVAAAEMKKYNFKGVFFVMTISINRPHYMTSEEIKQLSDEGHVIASHTLDHQNVKKLKTKEEWDRQIVKPSERIEAITGKPVSYFAYPFGLWNDTATIQIKNYGFKAAFQLTEKRSETEPLFTIRRTLVPGSWTTPNLLKRMKTMFP